MIAYLKLVRLPNVFTALADIGAGFLIVQAVFHNASLLACVAMGVASGCLYLAGMAFNDIADRKEDAIERPQRPLPSGTVSLGGAVAVGIFLMASGCLAAFLTSITALVLALMLATCILAYNFIGKQITVLAPLLLGLCRYLNVQLGMATYPKLDSILADSAQGWTLHAPAATVALYAAGLTAFSIQEEQGHKKAPLYAGWALLAASTGMAYGALPHKWALGPIVLLLALLVWRTKNLIRDQTPEAAKALVLNGVLGICIVDASLVLGFWGRTGWFHALLIALLILPALLVGKWLQQKEA